MADKQRLGKSSAFWQRVIFAVSVIAMLIFSIIGLLVLNYAVPEVREVLTFKKACLILAMSIPINALFLFTFVCAMRVIQKHQLPKRG